MSTCIEKQQIQFHIILIPYHQPIRLNVAFPLTGELSAKFMRPIFIGEGTCFSKDAYGFLDMRQIQAPLLAELQILLKPIGETDIVHTMPELA